VPHAAPATSHDWLALGPASRLLGVDPDTLRRWAKDGRIEAFTTPGGHRRFARRSLERLIAVRRRGRTPLASLGATPERLSRAYRRSYAADPTATSDPGDRDAFRRDGRLLVEALLAHLDGRDERARAKAERDAEALTDQLARRLAAAGTSVSDPWRCSLPRDGRSSPSSARSDDGGPSTPPACRRPTRALRLSWTGCCFGSSPRTRPARGKP
jgi:excisionase family DNA binding protein